MVGFALLDLDYNKLGCKCRPLVSRRDVSIQNNPTITDPFDQLVDDVIRIETSQRLLESSENFTPQFV